MRNTLLLLLLLLGSCVPPTSAEKSTYDVIAPDHRAYVEADESLTLEQKQRRYDLLDSWGIAVGAEAPAEEPK